MDNGQMALLVMKRGPNAGCRFVLDKPVTSAGRHPWSDIFLDEVTVSRKHAEFRWENNELHVVDLGSLNGTYVNQKAVDSAVLGNGDEVQLGKFRLMVLTKSKNDHDTGAAQLTLSEKIAYPLSAGHQRSGSTGRLVTLDGAAETVDINVAPTRKPLAPGDN